MAITKSQRRKRIRQRVRKKITGTGSRPRLSVFRSNNEIYAQVIDDNANSTLTAASSTAIARSGQNKSDIATLVGKEIGEKCKSLGIEVVIFDRSGYLYHGRVKALAEGAREAGLKF